MKTILATLLLLTATAFAESPYALNDKAILGNYDPVDKNLKPSDAGALLTYNEYGELIAYLLLPDFEHELVLQNPDENGVIYDSEEEYNCEDSACGGVSYIKITLQKVKNSDGETVPQLYVQYTETYPDEEASEEEGELIMSDTDYNLTLLWKDGADVEVPPVRALAKANADLDQLLTACRQAVEDSPLRVLHQSVCPSETAYVYDSGMDFEEVWPLILNMNSFDKTAKKTTVKALKKGLFANIRYELGKESKRRGKSAAALFRQVTAMEKFLKAREDAGDRIYLGKGGYGAAQLFLVDEKQHAAVTLWYASF